MASEKEKEPKASVQPEPEKVVDVIADLPGVGEKIAEKMKSAGYVDMMALAASSALELATDTAIGEETANKIINAARSKLKMGFEPATVIMKKRENIRKITTGSKSLDNLLGGGVETQAILEAYGAFGCLTGDARVTLANGQMVPLKTIAGNLPPGVHPLSLPVLSVSGSSIIPTQATALHIYSCPEVVKVSLANGMNLSVTPNHPLMTERGWIEAGNLSQKDSIRIVSDEHFPSDMVPLSIRTHIFKNAATTIRVSLPNKLTAPLAELVGLVLAEGWHEHQPPYPSVYRVCFTNTNPKLLDRFRSLVNEVFHIEANLRYKRENITAYAIDSVFVGDFLGQLEGLYGKAREKQVPEQFFRSPKAVIVRFLAGLYDGEGSVKHDVYKQRSRTVNWIVKTGEIHSRAYQLASFGRDVHLRSASKELLEGVQILLSKLGIRSWMNSDITRHDGKEFVGHKLHITRREDIERFYAEVGCLTLRLRDPLEKCLDTYKRRIENPNPNFIPIASSSMVPTADGKVYDLEVPGPHNFLTNTILSHNSGKSQLAHQLCVNVQLPFEKGGLNAKAIFIDTEQSLPYGETVFIRGPGGVQLVQIGELVEKMLKNGYVKIGHSLSASKNPEGLQAFSFDPNDYKIKPFAITGFIKHKEQDVFQVTLASGRKVKVTAHHNFFSLQNGTLQETKTSALERGCHIAVAGSLPVEQKETSLDLSVMLSGEDLYVRGTGLKPFLIAHKKELRARARKGGRADDANNWANRCMLPLSIFNEVKSDISPSVRETLTIGGWSRKNTLPIIFPLNADTLWLLGQYIAEGSCIQKRYSQDVHANRVIITTTSRKTEDRIRSIGKSIGVIFRRSKSDVVASSKPFAHLIKKLDMGDNAYLKKAPPFIFNVGKENIQSFLDGYIVGDSSIDKITGTTNCETVSPQLGQDLLHLTLALNTPARSTNTTRYKNSETRPQLTTVSVHWQTQPQRDARLLEIPNSQGNIGTILKSARLKAGLAQQELAKKSNMRSGTLSQIESGYIKNIRRSTLNTLIHTLPRTKEITQLQRLVDSDIWFDEVVQVEKCGHEPVYDIEVMPGGKPVQNFIGGSGGIILHNTFRPERIVDMAKALGMDHKKALDGVLVARAYNSDHQMLLAEKTEEIIKDNNVRLIVVDSITSTFRSDYTGRGTLANRQQKLNRHLHFLQRLADVYDLTIYITNQVMSRPDIMFGDPTAPVGGHILGHQATYRMYLRKSKGEKRIAKMIDSPWLPEGETIFGVGKDGIRDIEEEKEE